MSGVETDVAVIGAGPVGLFSVFALGQVGLRAIVIDSLPENGGQCGALYPDKPIYDIPSRPCVTGAELIDDLLAQAGAYAPRYLHGQRVEDLGTNGDRFELALSGGDKVTSGAVVIAAGAGAFGPNRPPLAGIAGYEGTSVFYAVRKPEQFRGQRVVIAGGGDSAADWAVILADVAASVTIIHRRPTFRAAPATMSRLSALAGEGRVTIVAPGTLAGLEGDGTRISNVLIDDGQGNVVPMPADSLLCFFGLAKDLSAISTWGIAADRNGIPVDPATMATRRSGVFAVGDIAHYPGKLKLILTGFSEAATAAHHARAGLRPNEHFQFAYSTTRGKPGLVQKVAST